MHVVYDEPVVRHLMLCQDSLLICLAQRLALLSERSYFFGQSDLIDAAWQGPLYNNLDSAMNGADIEVE